MRWRKMKKMEKAINEFLHPFECKSAYDNSFYCFPTMKAFMIAVTFNYDEEAENGFMRSVARQNPQVKLSNFTWSLLHELGHSQTFAYFMKDNNKEKYLQEVENLTLLENLGFDTQDQYADLPAEKLATQWAVGFANRNKDFVLELNQKLVNIAIEMEKANKWEELRIFRTTN